MFIRALAGSGASDQARPHSPTNGRSRRRSSAADNSVHPHPIPYEDSSGMSDTPRAPSALKDSLKVPDTGRSDPGARLSARRHKPAMSMSSMSERELGDRVMPLEPSPYVQGAGRRSARHRTWEAQPVESPMDSDTKEPPQSASGRREAFLHAMQSSRQYNIPDGFGADESPPHDRSPTGSGSGSGSGSSGGSAGITAEMVARRALRAGHQSASSPDVITHSSPTAQRGLARKAHSLTTSPKRSGLGLAIDRTGSLMMSTRNLMASGSKYIADHVPRRKPKPKRPQIKTATQIMKEKARYLQSEGPGTFELNDSRSWRSVTQKKKVAVRKPCCVLRPQSPIRLGWDLVTLFLLLYIAIATPFQIGFSVDAEGFVFYLEKLVDVFFITDLLLNFRTGIVASNGEEVLQPCQIAKAYVTGWFWIDLLSSIPFDFIFAGLNDLRSAKMLKAGRVVKALRVVRLTKLVRFLKLAVFIEKLEENFSINRNLLQLVKLLLGTVVMCHFFACMWYFFGSLDDAPGGWVYEQGVQNADTSTKYLTSFYWAVATLATVGYGDVVPISNGERTFAIIGMLLGGGYFGYIIATMASLVAKLDASTAAYHNKMDAIVSYMKSRNLPKELQMRIRKYYKHYLEKKTAFDESSMLAELSTFLRQEVAMFLINDTLLRIPIFRNRDPTFVADLITVLKPLTCSEGDFIMREGEFGREMYVLIRGELEVLHEGHALAVLGPGSYFGEMSVLYQEHFRRQATIRATTYCEMYSLGRDDLLFICRDHQSVLDDMRKIALDTYQELKRQREAFDADSQDQSALDASLLLHNRGHRATSSEEEELDDHELQHGLSVYDMGAPHSTKYEPRDSSASGPPMNFVVAAPSAPGGGHVRDSKEHPAGKSRHSLQHSGAGVGTEPGPGVSSLLASTVQVNPSDADACAMEMPRVGGYSSMFKGRPRSSVSSAGDGAGVDSVPPQVGEFAELAYDVRRQLSRMENLVDKYGSIPQSRLAAMSRPASRGPGLLLINPAAVQPVAEGGTLRRGRSQSVVAATSAKDIAKAVALAGGGGPGEGGGRAMPSSQRPFLQLSTSAGAIGARHNVAKRSGPSKRLPPVTAPAITAAAHEAGAAPQRLSTPEMDRLRGQLQAHHEKLSEQLTRMSELLRRF